MQSSLNNRVGNVPVERPVVRIKEVNLYLVKCLMHEQFINLIGK